MKDLTTAKAKRNWRIVKTPTRVKVALETLLGGLQLNVDPELINRVCVAETSGMIVYSKLWKKDWLLTLDATQTCDNITETVIASVPECAES